MCIALGVGLTAFALVDWNQGSDVALDSTAPRPATSSPTVLGSVVTAPPAAPLASAATPATFDLADALSDETAPRPARPSVRPTRVDPATTTTTPPALGPPWSIENTTTTTAGTTTTTTAPTTTSTTEATTTTTTPTTTTDTMGAVALLLVRP